MASIDKQEEELELCIKNPNEIINDFKLHVSPALCVRDVKERLERDYTGNPSPRSQRLVFAGHLLSDDAILKDIFGLTSEGEKSSFTLHLVVRPSKKEAVQSANTPTTSAQTPERMPNTQANAFPQDPAQIYAAQYTAWMRAMEQRGQQWNPSQQQQPMPNWPGYMGYYPYPYGVGWNPGAQSPQTPAHATPGTGGPNAQFGYGSPFSSPFYNPHYQQFAGPPAGQTPQTDIRQDQNVPPGDIYRGIPGPFRADQPPRPAAAQPVRARGNFRVFRISISSVLKWLFVLWILLSYFDWQRSFLFFGLLAVLWFIQSLVIPALNRRRVRARQNPQPQRDNGEQPVGGDARALNGEGMRQRQPSPENNNIQANGVERRRNIFHDIGLFFFGLFSSLFPSWQPPEVEENQNGDHAD